MAGEGGEVRTCGLMKVDGAGWRDRVEGAKVKGGIKGVCVCRYDKRKKVRCE